MAVEIKALHVKLHLNNQAKSASATGSQKPSGTKSGDDQLVETVVAQVLSILKEQQER